MIKKTVFLTFSTLFLIANQGSIPKFIDFGTQEFDGKFYNQEYRPENVTSCPFNCASELSTFFTYLKNELKIKTVVETGTFKANTAAFFGSVYDQVHTIEVSPEFYHESRTTLMQYPNVHCHLGSSPEILKQILPSLSGEPVLFYLDAHWYEDWPLLNELTQIANTHRDNCVIVIDDFKVPGRPEIPYDTHKEGEYSYEYVKNHIRKIFSDYTVHYLIPKQVQARGKFVAMPKSWSKTPE